MITENHKRETAGLNLAHNAKVTKMTEAND